MMEKRIDESLRLNRLLFGWGCPIRIRHTAHRQKATTRQGGDERRQMMDKANSCVFCHSTRVDRELDPQMPGLIGCVCRDCGNAFLELIVNRDEMQLVSDAIESEL
jgi:hypothetical protein